jgi:hypothetical protein
MHSRPGPHAERLGRTTSSDRVWIVGTILLFFVSFLVSFTAVRWLPDHADRPIRTRLCVLDDLRLGITRDRPKMVGPQEKY